MRKNDFAKSILDSPYNRIDGGEEVTFRDILSKYNHQRSGEKLKFYDVYAEDLGITEEEALAYQNWINDGNPTGIWSDKEFYQLQRLVYGKIIDTIDMGPILDESHDEVVNGGHTEYFLRHYSNPDENLLLKYWCRQAGIIIDNGDDFEEYAELIDWINNGEPTGIATPDEFYALQEKIYGRIIQTLRQKPLNAVKGFYLSVNHYKRYDFDEVVGGVQNGDDFKQKNLPYRCTPYFLIDGLFTLDRLECKDMLGAFQRLTKGVYGLKTSPDKMQCIVCSLFPEEQRGDIVRTIKTFSETSEIILVACTEVLPFVDLQDDLTTMQDYLNSYHVEDHENPFYDKVRELERLSTFSCIPDVGLGQRRKLHEN